MSTSGEPREPGSGSAWPARWSARRARMGASNARVAGGWMFVFFLAVSFANFAIWSWASPLFASPDEPTHVARAAAVVRGQFVGSTVGSDRNASTSVTIPAVFAQDEPLVECFQFRSTTPASCQPPVPTSTKLTPIRTYVGRYPPLYYAIVGLSSLIVQSAGGIYMMRLAGALLDAVFVALALFSVFRWSRSRLLLLAVMVAATPQAWFLGGMVNPSGLEIAVAICVWTSGVVLVLEHAHAPPRGLLAVFGVSLAVFALTRPLSPVWCAIALVVLGIAAGWRRVRALVSDRAVQWTALPVAACGALAVWWIVGEHALDLEPSSAPVPQPETFAHLVPAIFGHTWYWMKEMVGLFGWLDAFSPLLTYVIWAVVVAAIVLLACARATGGLAELRQASALVLLVLTVIVLPVAIVYREVHRLGIVWQGRDILPLAVGIPILAVALVQGDRALARRNGRALAWIISVTCALLGIASFAAYFEALRRYAVGTNGPIDFLTGAWHPPLGNTAALTAGLVAIACFTATIVFGMIRSGATSGGTPTDSLMYGRPSDGQRVRLDAERRPGS